jgi:hypothetical protein
MNNYIRNIALILIAAFALGFGGCSSPVDVPANRVKTIDEEEKNIEEGLEIFPKTLDFGYVARVDSKTMGFQLANSSKNKLTINSILPRTYMDMYFVVHPPLPITLGPKGSDSSSQYVSIQFTAKNLGLFSDTIRFNDKKKPTLALKAIVPSVTVSDCHFGGANTGIDAYKTVDVVNRGDSPAKITEAIIQDPDKVFNFTTPLPVTLKPGEFRRLIVRFTPKDRKQYKATLKFDIECEGYAHDQSQLTGYGI